MVIKMSLIELEFRRALVPVTELENSSGSDLGVCRAAVACFLTVVGGVGRDGSVLLV